MRKSLSVSPHIYRCPLRWGDMDAQRHINNGAYVDYLQEARVDFLLAAPPEGRALLDSGVLVVNHQVEYLRPVNFGDRPLVIKLWVDQIGGAGSPSVTTCWTGTTSRPGRGPVWRPSTWPATRCGG